MPRRKATRFFGDVTLNDFADATPRRGSRLKKTFNNAVSLRVTEDASKTSQELSWFDKEMEEFDPIHAYFVPADETCVSDAATQKTIGPINSRAGRASVTGTACCVQEGKHQDGGNEYPLHVWFLLSEYIHPEDVIRFSCICRSACMATSSPRFWIKLYRRYYTPDVKVPERLTPLCMERPRGLKACVVRTLFHVYPPFVERTRASMDSDAPRQLLRSYCILVWNKQSDKSHWNFHFKFQKRRLDARHVGTISSKSRLPDLLDFLRDMDANEEQGCRVLKVTCPHYVAVPALMGMFLTAVNVTGDKVNQRLRLTFSRNTYCQPSRHQNEDDMTIVFEPASGVHVLDWWHPQYPYM